MTLTFGRECVFGCRHKVWGGEGTCIVGAGPVDQCLCGEGYASKDSFGSPSCVPKWALTFCYTTAALFGAITVGFLVWTAIKQRRVSGVAQSRRAKLRLRLICSASAYSGTASITFCVAAATGNLWDSGMLRALYCISMPFVAMAVAHMLDVWVDTLPSKLLPVDSFATKVVHVLAKKQVFLWVGWASLVSLATFGLLMSYLSDTVQAVRYVNGATGLAGFCALLCFNFVGFHLTIVINKAKNQVNSSALGRAFYGQAIKTLWRQVAALSCAAIMWTISTWTLEPKLGALGGKTPILPLLIMVLDGFLGFSLAVHFAKVAPARGLCSSPGAASPTPNLRDVEVGSRSPGRDGSKAKGIFSGDKSCVSTTAVKNWSGPAPRQASLGRTRVVPTTGGVGVPSSTAG